MKVCTDSCLFGAVVAQYISEKNIQNILDIGTGTGLLSLMLAQKSSAFIDSIEINEDAYKQAALNFKNSNWENTFQLFHTSLQNFQPTKSYDLIIANPPFFENSLKSNDYKKNVALHAEELTLQELAFNAKKMMAHNGILAVLLPYQKSEFFIQEMKPLYLIKKVNVAQTTNHNFFRSILFFGNENNLLVEKNISIKNSNNNYTSDFIHYLKDYYLYL